MAGLLKSNDFGQVDGCRQLRSTNNAHHSRHHQNRKPVVNIESAEQIAGKEWHVRFLDSIGPASSRLVHGQKRLVSSIFKEFGRDPLIPCFHAQRKPRKMRLAPWCLRRWHPFLCVIKHRSCYLLSALFSVQTLPKSKQFRQATAMRIPFSDPLLAIQEQPHCQPFWPVRIGTNIFLFCRLRSSRPCSNSATGPECLNLFPPSP